MGFIIKFSVVVPVYNVEKYLSECIESILAQSFHNYEIILVNDGSTDSSLIICKEYAVANNKILIIDKENGGLSDARNMGIKESSGEYIVFVDSDDYIEVDALKNFNIDLEKSHNPDVLISQMKKVYEKSEIRYMDKSIPIELMKKGNKNEVINWMFTKSNNLWPSVRYIIKRDLIINHKLKFPYGFLHEDVDWTSKLFLYATTFTFSEYYWYNHRIRREGSITTTKNSKRTLDVISLVQKNIRDDGFNKIEEDLKNKIFKRLVSSLFTTLGDCKYYNLEDKKKVINSLYENQYIFKYTSLLHHKIFILFCHIFGFKISMSIMAVIHKR